jgi:adenine-specific DNA-methyltransferase
MSFELSCKINEKFWLGYLNSKFTSWYAYNFVYARAIRGMDFYNFYIQQIPIPNIDVIRQSQFVCLVDEILSSKQANPDSDTTHLERHIDELVFKLYDLTYTEVLVVCPDFWLSEGEYEEIVI